jgi:hypothetical protein
MLIYYGFPSCINGSRDLAEASRHFGGYRLVVLGDRLEQVEHSDHRNASQIIAACPEVNFFGYIDLGVSARATKVQNLTQQQIQERVRAWASMGAKGILLDDFGYDFQVTRERQNLAIDLCHQAGLTVMANSWEPRDALSSEPHAQNRRGLESRLSRTDYYLVESYQFKQGAQVPWQRWREKSAALDSLRWQTPCRIASVTTAESVSDFSLERYQYAQLSAALEGHSAFGWGEPNFCASDNLAPSRSSRTADFHRFYGRSRTSGQRVSRWTDAGQIVVDHQRCHASLTGKLPLIRRVLGSVGL